MKALTVIAFLMSAASLYLQFSGFPERLAPNITLPPMQVTVQSATPPISIEPSQAYINVQSALPDIHVDAVPKIDVHPAVPKINLWCEY